MPDGKNVTIIGGYDSSLTGSDLCMPNGTTNDPESNPVIIETDGTDNTRTWFWMTDIDGDLTVKGVTFQSPDNLGVGQGTVLYVAGGSKTYTFEDVFVSDSDGDVGRGPFFIGAGAINATLNLNRVAVNNTDFSLVNQGDVIVNGGAAIDASINGASFCDNWADGDGGAIDASNAEKSMEIISSDFKNNRAENGGALKMISSDIIVTGCGFESNGTGSIDGSGMITSVGGEGGAIFVEGCALNLTNSEFRSNESNVGGAIQYDDNGSGPIFPTYRQIVTNCNFWENVANDDGGGAINMYNVDNGFSITGSTFTNNDAKRNDGARGGGAIRVDGVCCILSNAVTNFESNSFTGNLCNGSTSRNNGNGGSDIKTYFGRVQNITNSKMQLAAQSDYPGDFSFASGNTFANTDTGTEPVTIADCASNQPVCVEQSGLLPTTAGTCISGSDYGDLPAGYPVVYAQVVNLGIVVWGGSDTSMPSTESGNQPSGDASADAGDDAVTITQQAPIGGGIMKVTVTGNSSEATTVYYSLSFDWDNNQLFEGAEVYTGSIMTSSPVTTPDIDVTVPGTFADGDVINARLVIAASAADASTGTTTSGSFVNGEVEDFQFTSMQVLPVELKSFYARANDKNALLSWSTASELNNEKFEIERSADGKEFTKVGTVRGNGTTNRESSYDFVDEGALWSSSQVYYRLKQVDYNGAYSYSEVVSVKGTHSKIEVYPNPAVGSNIRIINTDETDSYELYDAMGKLLMTGRSTTEVDVSSLKHGLYLLKIINRSGVAIHTEVLTR